MQFKNYKNIDYRIQTLLATNGIDEEENGMNQIDNHIHEIVYQTFLNSNDYY